MRHPTHLVLALLLSGCMEPKPEVTAPPPEQQRTPRDAVALIEDAAVADFIGVITAAESVDIAPRVAGIVSKIHVNANDTVTVDQPIADMDPAQMREELRAAQAAVNAAGAAVRQASVDLEDARRKLAVEQQGFKDGVSSKTQVDEAALGVKRSEASVERARATQAAESARAQTARDHVNDTTLRAPIAGTVVLKYRDAGNRIEAGQPIVKIVGHGKMRLRFAIPQELADKTKRGQKVVAEIKTYADEPVEAIIREVQAAVDPASGMIFVEAELSEAKKAAQVRPGTPARVRLVPTS